MNVLKWTKIAAGLLGIALLTFFAVRIYDTQKGLPLEPWHTYVPNEMRAEKLGSVVGAYSQDGQRTPDCDVARSSGHDQIGL
jgi:hypothetical protein